MGACSYLINLHYCGSTCAARGRRRGAAVVVAAEVILLSDDAAQTKAHTQAHVVPIVPLFLVRERERRRGKKRGAKDKSWNLLQEILHTLYVFD